MPAQSAQPRDDIYASPEEVAIACAALSEADFLRLGRIARLRARGLDDVDWQDLLHEAVQRALEGTRRWPLHVPFVVFLREVIRSLASEAWRVRAKTLARQDDSGVDGALEIAAPAPSPEEAALGRDLLNRLFALFEGDEIALGILAAVAEGLSPDETQDRLAIMRTDYDSARRRIRRRIAGAVEMFE